MTDITEWVKQIITVLILIGFLDLILPENELKGASKLIMGLFIISLFIQPLGKIFKIRDPAVLPMFSYAQREITTDHVINQGLRMRESWSQGLTTHNQALVKERISAILGMIDNLRLEKLAVDFNESQPTRVSVRAAPRDWKMVQPDFASYSRQLTERIQNAVRLVINLPIKNIEVTWHAPNRSKN